MINQISKLVMQIKSVGLLTMTGDTDPFTILGDPSKKGFIQDATIQQSASSVYKFLNTLGAAGVIFTLLFGALTIMWFKDPRRREEGKAKITVALIIAVCLSSFIFIITTILRFTSGLV